MVIRLLIFAGTRPEIIKTAPLVIEAKKHTEIETVYCLTGQHKTMAQEVFSIFNVRADDNLEIMRPNQTLNNISESVFAKVPAVLEKIKPDIVFVQGDTTTAAMAALASFNMKIPVGHIEAGLRSFNMQAPYPEEANRRLISVLSKFNFCPTDASAKNLRNEGVDEKTIAVTGNTVVDALRLIQEKYRLDDLSIVPAPIQKPFVLVTAHRRESFGEGFQNICAAIRDSALKYPHLQFVYPVHLNPNVKEPVHKMLGNIANVLLIEPVSYLPLLTMLQNCEFVLTDSGGIQEEAPSFGKHCIVMRTVTERMESVECGFSELVGTDYQKIISAIDETVIKKKHHPVKENPYGDGYSCERIIEVLKSH
ncbi:MAG: UDP-N-acetylglucosamine 2-epimerase (non-hydrolyzing) [Bacteroidetes bacterium]|nr:UDP-N-acetylglucosamine 2-epimerase (non-hydrolyzing) [Bacteroidota bacterium]